MTCVLYLKDHADCCTRISTLNELHSIRLSKQKWKERHDNGLGWKDSVGAVTSGWIYRFGR